MALNLLRTSQIFQKPIWCLRRNYINTSLNKVLVTQIRLYSRSVDNQNRWSTWKGIVTKFIPVGLCLIAVMQWRAFRKRTANSVATQWEINMYCALPLNGVSRTWGWLAERQVPVSLRPWIYGMYARIFEVQMNDAVSCDFKDYPTLADFFARPIKREIRPIDAESCLTSPCDGRVLNFGPVNTCTVEQVKGITYPLGQFLGKEHGPNSGDLRQSLLLRPEEKPTTLYQCVLYLAPGDYHRFHSPTEWFPEQRRHFAGKLLSVSPSMAKWIPGLFALNERVVYIGKWKHGFFSFTAVGATNVGSVKVYFDKSLHTNCRHPQQHDYASLSDNIHLEKGDMIGEFRMGSTIVLIFEAPLNFEFHVTAGQRIQVGQAVGNLKQVKYVDKVQNRTIKEMTSAG